MQREKVVLITGTRKGIGRELALFYLGKGYTVVGCSRKEVDFFDDHYSHFCLDVCDEKSVISMVRQVAKKYGRIDVLINNAGMASMNHVLLTPYSTIKKIFDTNVYGTMLFTREVAKVMMKSKKGRIVNFTTVATALRLEGESVYAASKAAVLNFTEVTARELAPYGITVNAVGPTPVMTDLIKAVPKNKINDLIDRQAIKRLGVFDDIKNVVDFFVQDSSDFVTAQTIFLGGVNN